MQSHMIGENACMVYTCQAIPGVHACVLTPGNAFGVTSYTHYLCTVVQIIQSTSQYACR